MDYTPLFFNLGLGAVVGLSLGIFGTRNVRFMVFYMVAGMLGAGLFSAIPFFKGSGYFANSLKFSLASAAVMVGLAILFSPAKTKR